MGKRSRGQRLAPAAGARTVGVGRKHRPRRPEAPTITTTPSPAQQILDDIDPTTLTLTVLGEARSCSIEDVASALNDGRLGSCVHADLDAIWASQYAVTAEAWGLLVRDIERAEVRIAELDDSQLDALHTDVAADLAARLLR